MSLDQRREREIRAADQCLPAQLHRAAHAEPVDGADADRRQDRTAPRRHAPVHPLQRPDLRDHRRPHARGAAARFAGGEFVAGRRFEGHLDHRRSQLTGGGESMLARVAENIYWMARYIERAEDLARLISVTASLTLDLPKDISPIWSQLIAITGAEAIYSGRDM